MCYTVFDSDSMNLFINKAKNGVETLYVHKKYRDENGKSTTKVIERLGTMEELSKLHDDPVAWANEYIKELNRKEKESSRKIMVGFAPMRQIDMDNRVLYCGGYLFLQKIYCELGLGKICRQISDRYKFEYNLDAVLSRLVFGRILSPSSKLSTDGCRIYSDLAAPVPVLQTADSGNERRTD